MSVGQPLDMLPLIFVSAPVMTMNAIVFSSGILLLAHGVAAGNLERVPTRDVPSIQQRALPFLSAMDMEHRFQPVPHDAETGVLVRAPAPVLQIAMVGDSITEGCAWDEVFPETSIANHGIDASTSEDVLRRLDEILSHAPQAVFVMIGINDLARGFEPKTIISNIKAIVERIAASGSIPILQSTLFVGRDHRARRNADVEAINLAMRRWSEERHIRFVDLNARLAPAGYLSEEFTDDGVHLTAEAYRIWAEQIRSLVHQVGRPGFH